VQGAKGAVSSEHEKLEPAWSAENANVALVPAVVELGPESIVVSGAIVSTTVHAWLAGDASVVPAELTARTWSV
jgi:hypothetical protein